MRGGPAATAPDSRVDRCIRRLDVALPWTGIASVLVCFAFLHRPSASLPILLLFVFSVAVLAAIAWATLVAVRALTTEQDRGRALTHGMMALVILVTWCCVMLVTCGGFRGR